MSRRPHPLQCTARANIQPSQLLDLLLELNCSFQLPDALRFDVSTLPPTNNLWNVDLKSTNGLFADIHRDVQAGKVPQNEFLNLRRETEEAFARRDAVFLSELERTVPHTAYDPATDTIPPHLADVPNQLAFLTPAREDEYLQRLDAKLGDQWPLPHPSRPPTTTSPPPLASLSAREADREIELRNPLSVHNWLKKHNVAVGEVDERGSEASGGGAGGAPASSSKRTAAAGRNLAKKVGDRAVGRARERDEGSPMGGAGSVGGGSGGGGGGGADDEASLLGVDVETPKGRNKKARDADETYRPKGGSGKKPKRKREDGEGPASGERKKARTSMAATPVTGEGVSGET